jgi:hypothetical protein
MRREPMRTIQMVQAETRPEDETKLAQKTGVHPYPV